GGNDFGGRDERSGTDQLGAKRSGQRFPDSEPAARHLFGRRAAAPRVRRDRRYVLDLVAIADLLDEEWQGDLGQPVLNSWLARGAGAQLQLRHRLMELLSDAKYRDDVEPELIGQTEVRMHLPCIVGDYTDFYVGIHHATNVGKQF